MTSSDCVQAYTDGACKGNPGPGGWGVVLEYKGQRKTLSGGEHNTTNNRMELRAVIEALKSLKKPARIHIHTDSQYVHKGITEWLGGWKRKGWRTASGQPVKNQDLWQVLDELVSRHTVSWEWVRGHAGHAGNEEADRLANEGVASLQQQQ